MASLPAPNQVPTLFFGRIALVNLQFDFVRVTSLHDIAVLRTSYVDDLIEPQELMLEVWVAESRVYRIDVLKTGLPCGYFIEHAEKGLLEFHLEKPFWIFAEPVMKRIVGELRVRMAWVKSFDHLFFSACMGLEPTVRSAGLLVRDYVPRPLPSLEQLRFDARPATIADLERIQRVRQTTFMDTNRLRLVIETGRLVLFEHASTVLGFGIIQPVMSGRHDVDLAIAVDEMFRRRGYAVYMLKWLIEHALACGLRPIAGCSVRNSPSRMMGERVGMSARYRLLEVSFPANL